MDPLKYFSLHVNYRNVFTRCLDSHYDGTQSLKRIHWWASDAVQHFSKLNRWVELENRIYFIHEWIIQAVVNLMKRFIEKIICLIGFTNPAWCHDLHLHLADAFIQSDLKIIHFFCQYVCSLGIEPTTFALLTQCSTTEPQDHFNLFVT